MKRILFIVIALNFVFFLFASMKGPSQRVLPDTDAQVPKLIILGLDKPSEASAVKTTRSKHRSNTERHSRKPGRRLAHEKSAKKKTPQKKPQKIARRDSNWLLPDKPGPVTAIDALDKDSPLKRQPDLDKPLRSKGKPQCVTLGPFIDKDDAFELNNELKNLKVQSVIRRVTEQERFWIYVQGKNASEKPRKVLRTLKQNGIRDYQLIASKGKKYIISLGWFDKETPAAHRMKKLAELGIDAKLQVKGAKGEQIWVDYLLPRGKKLPQAAQNIITRTKKESFLKQQTCGG